MSPARTKSTPAGLPLGYAEPDLSYGMRRLVDLVTADAAALRRPDTVTPALCEEARTVAEAFAGLVRHRAEAGAGLVALWLEAVNRGMAFPLQPAGLTSMLQAVLTTSGDVPAVIFNADTVAAAGRRFDRMSAKNVDDVLRPIGRDLVRKARLMRELAGRPIEVENPEPTESERLAAADTLRAAAQAIREAGVDDAPSSGRGRALHLSDEALLASYERLALDPGILQGAAIRRRDMLRTKLAARAFSS